MTGLQNAIYWTLKQRQGRWIQMNTIIKSFKSPVTSTEFLEACRTCPHKIQIKINTDQPTMVRIPSNNPRSI